MMLIFGLMLLLQTAACVERFCSFHQSDQICYAALGHKLNLLLMVDASKYDLKIKKRINNTTDDPVCRVKQGRMRIKECDLFNNRPDVSVTNGTLIINPVVAADSGIYTLEFTSSTGTQTFINLQVNIEAPIGSVEVSIICSSSGVMRVSCSSEGDQLLYSWTLNGNPVMDGNATIELDEKTDGNITCSVKNNVSHGQKTVSVTPCPGPTTANVAPSLTSAETSSTQGKYVIQLSLIALSCAALIMFLLFIIAYCVYRKKQLKPTPAPAEDVELVYAQISHEKLKKKSKQKKSEESPAADEEYAAVAPKERNKRLEEEVQYGEVKFTPNRANDQQQSQENCVYSQVQRR